MQSRKEFVITLGVALALAFMMAWLVFPSGTVPTQSEGKLRIISFSPALTETIFEVGAGETLVGSDQYSFERPQALEAVEKGQIRNLGSPFTGVNLEAAIRLKPTLIVTERTSARANLDPLREIGAEFHELPFASLDEIKAAYLTIGRLTDRTERAAELVAELESQLALPASGAAPKVVMFNTYFPDRELSAVAGSSYQTDILTALGAINVYGEIKTPTTGVERERVIHEIDPDLIILLGSMKGGVTEREYLRSFDEMRAIKAGFVYTIRNDEALQQGPTSVIRLAKELRRVVADWRARTGS